MAKCNQLIPLPFKGLKDKSKFLNDKISRNYVHIVLTYW